MAALMACTPDQSDTPPEPGTLDEIVSEPVSFDAIVSLPARAPDAVERYGAAPQQFMHYFRATANPSATIVFAHGGCWSNAYDLKHADAFAAALADDGYDVWSVEYRRVGDPGGGWPGAAQDMQAAVTRVREHAPTPPLVIAGHSAGGHLAVIAGLGMPDTVDAVIGLAAITRLREYAHGTGSCERMTAQLMGGMPAEQSAAYASADPTGQTLHPTTLLLHGRLDPIVSINHSEQPGARQYLEESTGHFDWLHPQSAAFALLIERLASLSAPRPGAGTGIGTGTETETETETGKR